jgi:hypothetical protein
VPGRPLITEFQPVSDSKAVVALEYPTMITEITFFLLPTSPVPIGYGAILYYSVDQVHWELLGAISPEKPSGIFRTGWPTNEEVVKYPVVYLGVSLEPMTTVENLTITTSGYEDRFNFAHKIALDLFQFMTSFASSSSPAGMMVVPTGIFDKWFERFERKYRLDPNFMLKQNST